MMKQKLFLLFALLLGTLVPHSVLGYDFTAVCSSGQTLGYTINGNVVAVSASSSSSISGNLVIPSAVTYNGTTYSVTGIGNGAFSNRDWLTSVTIPNSVTGIGQYAFRDCTGLTSVTIPNSVTGIGYSVFSGCTGLTTMNYNAVNCSGNGFIYGSSNWLYGCTGLTTLNIGNEVTSIPNYAFHSRSSLMGNLVIPNSVTSIGSFAFYYCTGLTGSLTIPNSVTSIGNYAFEGCTGLTSVTFGNSVTSIGGYAFRNCTSLNSVTISNSVNIIYNSAFSGCTGLTTMNYNAVNCSVNSTWLERQACSALTTLNLGNSVETIPDNAFSGCTGLTNVTIPNSVTDIGQHAFRDCTGLTSVTIGNSVTRISYCTFKGCTGLSSVTIPNSVTRIHDQAFSDCTGLTTLNYNAVNCSGYGFSDDDNHWLKGCTNLTTLNIGSAVETIPVYAFYYCSSLTGTITIPESVTTVGGFAFQNCRGITQVNYNAANASGAGFSSDSLWLSGCTGLRTLNIGSSVETIPNFAFYNLSRLTGGLTIPNSVTSIGNSAFQGCTGLTGSLTIPNSVTNIGVLAFGNCTGLTSLDYNAVNCSGNGFTSGNNWLNGCTGLTTLNIGNEVTSIPNYAFYSRSSLIGTLAIPNSVTSVGNYAFYGCTGLTGSLTIPNSVTSIGFYSFYNCTGFTGQLVLPSSISSIGNYTFAGCSNLNSVSIPESVTTIGDYSFNNCSGLTGWLTIPSSVTAIGQYGFSGCSGLNKIVVGESVASIGNYAFSGCTEVDTLCFLSDNPATLAEYTLYNYNGIYYSPTRLNCVVTIPCNSLPTYQYAWGNQYNYFDECLTQYTVTVSTNNASWGSVSGAGTYYYNEEVVLTATPANGYYLTRWIDGNTDNPRTFRVTRDTAFTAIFGVERATTVDSLIYSNAGLTKVIGYVPGLTHAVIPNSVRTIADSAFLNCTTLRSVTIPESVTSIGKQAFYGCTGLTGILIIPSLVDTIGRYAFANCNFDTIRFLSSTPAGLAANALCNLNNTRLTCVLAIPCGTLSAYMSVWGSGYNYYDECSPQYTVTVVSNNNAWGSVSGGGTYAGGATATLTATANTGYHFGQWNDGNTQNPRTVTVTADVTYTAQFVANQYTVTVYANDPTMGTVTGGGTYVQGATVTLTATPNTGYHFVQWSDGNTQNPRTVTVTGNATYTAQFVANQYTVTVYANDPTMGTVTGGGTYVQGATVTLSATANTGYHFVQWNDGNTQNPRTVTVTGNATYVAQFVADQSPNQYTVTVYANDPTMGTVTGGGTYVQGATATLSATANTGYRFVQWNDGNTDNPRTVTVTADATYMAYFAADQSDAPQIAYVGVDSNGHNAVSWTPQSGTSPVRYNVYREGIQAGVYELVGVVNASGATSYSWTDDQSNPATRAYSYRLAEVAADNTESDLSIPHTTIHLQISQGQGDAWNLAWTPYVGFNYSTYNLYRGTDASSMTLLTTLPATATTYSDLNTGGTAYYYQIEVVQLSGAKTTAVSSRSNIVTTDPDPQTYTLTVLSADVLRGTVTGGGSYTEGTMATLTAEANEGYVFLQWQDGSTANPRNILVTANGTYMAYFTQTEGIADAEGNNVTITARNGRIQVSGAEGRQVTLSDALGRILYRGTAMEPLTVEAPATGIYLLQVEGYPAHRISVVR